MKASELKGRAVVSLAQAEKVGTVASLVFDPATSRVAGLTVKTGVFGAPKWLRAADVRSVGVDAVTINDRSLLHEHDTEVPDLKDFPILEDLTALKVVSQNGTLLGMLGEVEIDSEHFFITRYLLSAGFWDHLTHGEKSFGAVAGLRFGKELLIVPDGIAAELQPDETDARATPAVPPSSITSPPPTIHPAPDPSAPAGATVARVEPPLVFAPTPTPRAIAPPPEKAP